MTDEIWKPIVGLGDRYEASNRGRVRSVVCRQGRRKTPLILKQFPSPDGYLMVNIIRYDGEKRVKTKLGVNRAVLLAFSPVDNSAELHAAHLDGAKDNNNLENLEWTTREENEFHKRAHGTHHVGEAKPHARLTEGDIREILELKQEGISNVQLGKRFGVSDVTVGNILRGRKWKHVTQ